MWPAVLKRSYPSIKCGKDRYMLMISSILLFGITAFIVLMRAESYLF